MCFLVQAYGQPENRYQPDSIYQNRKVKKIYAYLNSKKDLSEIIEFNCEGLKFQSMKYSASYDHKTRAQKRIESKSSFMYNSHLQLSHISDTIFYWDNSFAINNTYFEYDSSRSLVSSKYYRGNFTTPDYETFYNYEPFKTTTIQRKDSLVVYEKSKEYEKDFYVCKFYGYYLKAKLKTVYGIEQNASVAYQYSDENDLQRFEDYETILNTFNSKAQLVESYIKSVFMNDRRNEYKLRYKYYPSGLLHSIRGYIPEFFTYEFN